MRRTVLATVEFIGPHGMRCPYCQREIAAGGEVVEELEGMVGDTLLVLTGICPKCADLIEKNGLEWCEACIGTGEWGHGLGVPLRQCPRCHGTREVIRSAPIGGGERTTSDAVIVYHGA